MVKSLKELKEYLKKVPKDSIVLVNVAAANYFHTNMEILRFLCNEEALAGVYVTVNKPYDTIKRVLEEENVNTKHLFFIDAITRNSGGEGKNTENVFYLDSPENLTGLGVALSEAVNKIDGEYRFLFLDSLSTLLLYHNSGTVAKFSHFLTGRMRMWRLRGILISLEKETDPKLTSQLSQFCDLVVDIDK